MGAKFAIYRGADGHPFVGEVGFGEVVERVSVRSGCSITRHVADQAAVDLLHAVGQHTQAEVVHLSAIGTPGFGPANPVNKSTHCRFNDGIAYRVWLVFARIPKWARGIDCNVARRDAFCAEARKEGYTVTVTYPGSVGEAQHVNFRKAPVVNWWAIRPVKLHSKGKRAHEVVKLLRFVASPKDHERYLKPHGKASWKIEPHHVEAIKRFQRDHHQTPDGIVGVHTIRALRASKRHQAKNRKKGK